MTLQAPSRFGHVPTSQLTMFLEIFGIRKQARQANGAIASPNSTVAQSIVAARPPVSWSSSGGTFWRSDKPGEHQIC